MDERFKYLKVKDEWEGWDNDKRAALRGYLSYLRALGDGTSNTSAGAAIRLDHQTVSKIITGIASEGSLRKHADSLIQHFIDGVQEGVEIDSFDVWLLKQKDFGSNEIDGPKTSSGADNSLASKVSSAESSTQAEETLLPKKISRSWIAIGFCLVVLIGGLPMAIQTAYWTWQEARAVAIYEQELADKDRLKALERLPPRIDWSDLNINFRMYWAEGRIAPIISAPSSKPLGSTFELSKDGQNFQSYGQINEAVADYELGDTVLARLTSDRWDAPTEVVDITEQIERRGYEYLEEELRGRFFTCDRSGCRAKRDEICGGFWSEFSFRDGENILTMPDLNELCDSPPFDDYICASYRNGVHVFPRSGSFQLRIRTKSGTNFAVPLNVDEPNFVRGYVGALDLTPTVEDSVSPFVMLRYYPSSIGRNGQKGDFQLLAKVSGCLANGVHPSGDIASFFYDVGEGFVKAAHYGGVFVPSPVADSLTILLESDANETYGPYSYRFSPEQVVLASVEAAPKPDQIPCWRDSCRVTLSSQNDLGWAKVNGISFGSSPAELEIKVELSLNARDIIGYFDDGDPRSPNRIFDYVPMPDDAFFQIHYSDGTNSIVQKLERP